jgi:hypothetical protein
MLIFTVIAGGLSPILAVITTSIVSSSLSSAVSSMLRQRKNGFISQKILITKKGIYEL